MRRINEVLDELGYLADPECAETASRFYEVLQQFAPTGAPPALETLATPSFDPLVLRDLPFHSLCAHLRLPFFGTADIALQPRGGRLTGLGAIVRTLEHYARRPQIQERLGAEIAARLGAELDADVLVRLRARQMCVEMRGVRSAATIETWASHGAGVNLRSLLHA